MRADGVLQTCNPGAERLQGHHEDRIVGQPVQALMPPSAQEMFEASLRQLRRGEWAPLYDTHWVSYNGTKVDVTVNLCAPRDAGGDLIGYSAVARDITTQVENQRQLRRLAQCGRLTIRATLSIGATLAVPGESVSNMTARSDHAMYEAKRAGRNTVTCS